MQVFEGKRNLHSVLRPCLEMPSLSENGNYDENLIKILSKTMIIIMMMFSPGIAHWTVA